MLWLYQRTAFGEPSAEFAVTATAMMITAMPTMVMAITATTTAPTFTT